MTSKAVKGIPTLAPSAEMLAIAQRNQVDSPLLRLPAELQNTLYDLVLDLRNSGILHHNHNTWDRFEFSRTSRQIFAETAGPYYTKKILLFSNGLLINTADLQTTRQFFNLLTPSQAIVTQETACRERFLGGFIKVWRKIDQLCSVQKVIFVNIPRKKWSDARHIGGEDKKPFSKRGS